MNSFDEIDQHFDRLLADEKIDEAIYLMNKKRDLFPEHEHIIASNIIYCYRHKKEYKHCLELIHEEHRRGFFFGLEWEGWDPMRELPDYKIILTRNEELKSAFQVDAELIWQVQLPEGYSADNRYPLLILLHGDGNGCNIEYFSNQWKTYKTLEKGWITAYVQSSQVSCYKGYGWTDDYVKSRKEIKTAFTEICRSHSVDESRVIIGGFSGGAMASLNILGNNTIPLKGIIALCPGKTDDTEEKNFKAISKSKVKAVILEGEKSDYVQYHTDLMERFENVGISAKYIVNPDIDHQVPIDMDGIAVEVIDFIIQCALPH